jgi:hypothetical protein
MMECMVALFQVTEQLSAGTRGGGGVAFRNITARINSDKRGSEVGYAEHLAGSPRAKECYRQCSDPSSTRSKCGDPEGKNKLRTIF